jgi:hypothetical protein
MAATISFEALVRMTRVRLCLPAARDEEVAAALIERGADVADPATWSAADPDRVALWWDV